MRAGTGLMAVIPQQQVHQSPSQSQGQSSSQSQSQQQSSHGRPNSLPSSTPVTHGLKRLSDEDSGESVTEAKRYAGQMYANNKNFYLHIFLLFLGNGSGNFMMGFVMQSGTGRSFGGSTHVGTRRQSSSRN